MIKYLSIVMIAVLLTGCGSLQRVFKTEIVTVNKPVPYCPAPPVVPKYEFLVDALTAEDANDPGKVGQAYKHDMTHLRLTDKLHRLINEQYRTTAGNLAGVQSEIDEIFKQIDEAKKNQSSEVLPTN